MADLHPAWLDRRQFPFASRELDVGPGRMHYVDVGPTSPRSTVLLLHGNPTWSFMYRRVIRSLCNRHRCIAPDWLGFGLSDRPRDWAYCPAEHLDCLRTLVDRLQIDKMILVMHDWGGPIGCWYATENVKRIRGLVIANSWLWPPEEIRLRAFGRIFASRPGSMAITHLNALAHMMPLGTGGRSPLTASTRTHYLKAQTSGRHGSMALAGAFHSARDWLASLWQRRAMLQGLPIAFVWGLMDPAVRPTCLERWLYAYPDAYAVRLDDVGHFVPEEAPDVVARAVKKLIDPL